MDAAMLGGRVAAWSYQRGWHGRLSVVRREVTVSGQVLLPAPLVIGFASDFHAGPTTHPGVFEELAAQVRRVRPDVLLLGGDYVSLGARHVDQLRDCLGALSAPLGVFGVIGNHDVWHGRAPIEAALREAGIELLHNRNVALPAPFGMVSICGIDDPWTGEPCVPAAFAGAGPVRVFLTHSPDGLHYVDGETFDVAFAGHTHGGQVARADGTPMARPQGPLSRRYCYGSFDLPDNGPLIVSRGVGCSKLPLRINADPELVVCTLRSQ
ncbi:metallophosphoesterase [Massilia horti]|uniref:Metallophosphoesterase n=1 Tax=Massilia horti TaxID=2562153 RepID=A0A4Y9T4P7_9BURK|nr:metallophosphoesterase [Massilia horti]